MKNIRKEQNKPILSLCIPTDGNIKWVLPVLESIYTQNVDFNLLEVIVTDNGGKEELANALVLKNYPNLKYFKSETHGFINIIDSLKQANGVFRKMINHRSCLLPEILNEIIDLINQNKYTRPIIYFSDNRIENDNDVIECKNYDELIYHLNYWISWSAGIGIWEDDSDNLDKIKFDPTFPNISVVLDLRNESKCLIWNKKYQEMLDDSGKGGYNLFEAFAVILPNLLTHYRKEGKITIRTYESTKKKLFGFLVSLYDNEVLSKSAHSYVLTNIKESVSLHYKTTGYFMMVIKANFIHVKQAIKGRIKQIVKHKFA